eukprot:5618197-Pleurochrysis_carterae.AAC.2
MHARSHAGTPALKQKHTCTRADMQTRTHALRGRTRKHRHGPTRGSQMRGGGPGRICALRTWSALKAPPVPAFSSAKLRPKDLQHFRDKLLHRPNLPPLSSSRQTHHA